MWRRFFPAPIAKLDADSVPPPIVRLEADPMSRLRRRRLLSRADLKAGGGSGSGADCEAGGGFDRRGGGGFFPARRRWFEPEPFEYDVTVSCFLSLIYFRNKI